MRKMKKINGFLVVKFNARELREWEGTALGNYGVIDEELYTGKLEIDRGSMEYDNIETIEEAVEMARGLYTEEDYNEQPSTYAVVEEAGETVVERVTVEPQSMIDGWTKSLKEQIKSPHYPGVNANTARHELYGFKVALTELGLLDSDACLVLPNAFGPEELLAYICDKVCKERIPGRSKEEHDAVCENCAIGQNFSETDVQNLHIHGQIKQELGGIIRELKHSRDFTERRISAAEARAYLRALATMKAITTEEEKLYRSEISSFFLMRGTSASGESPEAALRIFALEYQGKTYQQPGETAETAKRHLCLRLGDDPNEKTVFEAVKVLNEEAGSPEE